MRLVRFTNEMKVPVGKETPNLPVRKAGETNICFDCERACGGCPWSQYDDDKKRTGFKPAPGWTAEEVMYPVQHWDKGIRWVRTYHITDCPLFVRTPDRKTPGGELTEWQNELFLRKMGVKK